MYQSSLHGILRSALEATKWIRSTKDEDNYRQVLCASLYEKISANNVEIPSTRSAHGDIKIFGRRIEIKYASNQKVEMLDKVLEDFDLLLEGKIEFSIVALRLEMIATDDYLHNCLRLPMLRASGGSSSFASHTCSLGSYMGPGIFLPACWPHAPKPMTLRVGKGKSSTAFLTFDNAVAIDRSAVLEVCGVKVHCDVVGSREDGFLAFLYKRMESFDVVDQPGSSREVQIPYAPAPITLARCRDVNVRATERKFVASAGATLQSRGVIEAGVPLYAI